jgi:hypothetical protein
MRRRCIEQEIDIAVFGLPQSLPVKAAHAQQFRRVPASGMRRRKNQRRRHARRRDDLDRRQAGRIAFNDVKFRRQLQPRFVFGFPFARLPYSDNRAFVKMFRPPAAGPAPILLGLSCSGQKEAASLASLRARNWLERF